MNNYNKYNVYNEYNNNTYHKLILHISNNKKYRVTKEQITKMHNCKKKENKITQRLPFHTASFGKLCTADMDSLQQLSIPGQV